MNLAARALLALILFVGLSSFSNVADADIVYSAMSANSSVINNFGTPGGVAGDGSTYTGATDNFNNSGFTSTNSINTLIGGGGLIDSDVVTITLDVASITGGNIRSNGVVFGMSGDSSTLLGGTDSMLVQMEASNSGNDILITPSSFQDNGDTGLQVFDGAITNGFLATLTADKDGYEFSLTGVHTTSPHIITGTFSGTEFVDHFGTGHFYYTVQKFNQTTALVTNINSATIDVSAVPEPSTLGLMALGLIGIGFRRRRSS